MNSYKKVGVIILILLGCFIAFVTVILGLVLCIKGMIAFVKKKPFPKKLMFATLSGIVLIASIYTYEVYFFTFDNIDKEHAQPGYGPVTSPSEQYTASAFYEPYGGAAGGVNVWVEITYHDKGNNVETVYYGDAKSNFSLEWQDENSLFILNEEPEYPDSNRSIALKIGKEIYHENGFACKSLLMKNKYHTCYQD